MAFPNRWYHRRVAEGAAKACWICYKLTSSVLTTPDSKDFFYICTGHLQDRHFAIPDADELAAAKAKREHEALQSEIENVKREYEEKRKKKDDKETGGEGGKRDEKKEGEDAKNVEKTKEMDDKMKILESQGKAEYEPRIYSLHKHFYQMRLDRIKNAEMAKRNRERLQDPTLFPSVPTSNPGDNPK